jgi:Integrase core domain
LDKALKPGEVIHSDVLGPLPQSFQGFKYAVSFIDEWTRHVTVMPMKQKSDVLNCFKEYKINFEKQYEMTIKSIHSDNGGEYTPVAQYAKGQGIRVSRAAPYTSEANGIAERMNRTLVKTLRTTLAQSGMYRHFWVEAMFNADRVRNSLPNENGVSPQQALTNQPSNIEAFRPFGCLGMVHMHAGARKKLDMKSVSCVPLCTLDHKNYRMFDLKSKRVMVTRNLAFSENKFPLKTLGSNDLESDIPSLSDDCQTRMLTPLEILIVIVQLRRKTL